jgi:hypothetical protein
MKNITLFVPIIIILEGFWNLQFNAKNCLFSLLTLFRKSHLCTGNEKVGCLHSGFLMGSETYIIDDVHLVSFAM